jgi:hypothetical protein
MIEITTDMILYGVGECRTVVAWALDLELAESVMWRGIEGWRVRTSQRERDELAEALASAGIDPRTVAALVGAHQRGLRGRGLDDADRDADAAHIARWGYV